jgi:hypothetical protein
MLPVRALSGRYSTDFSTVMPTSGLCQARSSDKIPHAGLVVQVYPENIFSGQAAADSDAVAAYQETIRLGVTASGIQPPQNRRRGRTKDRRRQPEPLVDPRTRHQPRRPLRTCANAVTEPSLTGSGPHLPCASAQTPTRSPKLRVLRLHSRCAHSVMPPPKVPILFRLSPVRHLRGKALNQLY